MDLISGCVRYPWKYDVFLSFREEDTKSYNFTRHLCDSLRHHGVSTFMNCGGGGERVSGEEEIRVSKISIVVFSENYASSPWCLDELVKIIDCRELKQQIVRPVFYNVDPSDVGRQKGSFGLAFSNNEIKFKNSMEKVDRWRSALTKAASLSGWDGSNVGNERRFIDNITEEICYQLVTRKSCILANPFEVHSQVPEDARNILADKYDYSTQNYMEHSGQNVGVPWGKSGLWQNVGRSKSSYDLDSISGLPKLQPIKLRSLENPVRIPESIFSKEQQYPELSNKASTQFCKSLEALNLSYCASLARLPESISSLTNLESLNLSCCIGLLELPESIGSLHKLVSLNVSHCASLVELPESVGSLHKLEILNVSHCASLVELPESVGSLHKLDILNLSYCVNLVRLPVSIGSLHKLSFLDLNGCENLRYPGEQEEDARHKTTLEHPKIAKYVKGSSNTDMEEKAGHVVQVENEADENLPEHLKVLVMYSSLFPSDYEFRKDELVQLWIAEGFIHEIYKERMENTGIAFFNWLENKGFFVRSRCDFKVDFDSVCSMPIYSPTNFLYKVNSIKLSILGEMISRGGYFRVVDGKLDGVSEMTQHLSLICEDIDEMTLEVLQKCKHLSTLLFLSGCRSSIKHVPRNFFSSLKFLRTLNLSGTLISELPSSIRVVKTLRYLDVSETPIIRFPESIDSLHNLQTIKLRGCVYFVQLPKGTKNLINLRHIELDIIRQLDSLPAFLGNLTNLQTLAAFLVERDDGCRIEELKNLNHLKGAFCISRLENVMTTEEAMEASLSKKTCLQSLELRWSNLSDENAEEQERILESLQPHYGLQELEIQNYGGSILPSWISDPSFADLVVVTLYRCKNCKLLPSMGQLPALKFLSIIEMNEVKEINHQFFRNSLEVDPELPAFPKLERLEVDTMPKLKEWQVRKGDLPSLLRLTVDSCPELVTFPSLSELKSLRHLELRHCPKLLPWPHDGLPMSLESLIIIDCSELKDWCRKEGGHDQSSIRHSVWLDHEEILNPDKLD